MRSYWKPMTKKAAKEAEKEQKIRKKMFGTPAEYKGGRVISYGASGHEASTLKQYREVAPKGKYFYKKKHGTTTWYKR